MGKKVSQMTSEDIAEMTEKFIKSGGKIEKVPSADDLGVARIFYGWRGLIDKESEKGKGCHYWTEEKDMFQNYLVQQSKYRLCPYNAYIVDNEWEEYWNESKEKYWKESIIPLMEKERMEDISRMGMFESEIRWT